MEKTIVDALKMHGPLTGWALRDALQVDGFGLWKACVRSEEIGLSRVGRRYLRLDRKVEGYARLSPSILREFLTYSVVGLVEDAESLHAAAAKLAVHIASVNAAKRKVAERVVTKIEAGAEEAGEQGVGSYCILLGGDVVHHMAHDAPRTERSTGLMVKGSDIDLVVITTDETSAELARHLDEAIHREKHRLLANPASREEIDYVVKPLSRVRQQVAFDTFKHMVACKILQEAVLVSGDAHLFERARSLLAEEAIPERLIALEANAAEAREKAETHLLGVDEYGLAGEDLYLFFTSEETEEFE